MFFLVNIFLFGYVFIEYFNIFVLMSLDLFFIGNFIEIVYY